MRKYLVVLICLVMTFSLSGCGFLRVNFTGKVREMVDGVRASVENSQREAKAANSLAQIASDSGYKMSDSTRMAGEKLTTAASGLISASSSQKQAYAEYASMNKFQQAVSDFAGIFGMSSRARADKKYESASITYDEAKGAYDTARETDEVLQESLKTSNSKKGSLKWFFIVGGVLLLILIICLICGRKAPVVLQNTASESTQPQVVPVVVNAPAPQVQPAVIGPDLEVNYDKMLDEYSARCGVSRESLLQEHNGNVRRAAEDARLRSIS